jgi:hypothetical protein
VLLHILLAGFATSGKPKALPRLPLLPHKGLAANPLCGFAYWKSRRNACGVSRNWSGKPDPAQAGMRPKTKYQSKHKLPAAYAKHYFQP